MIAFQSHQPPFELCSWNAFNICSYCQSVTTQKSEHNTLNCPLLLPVSAVFGHQQVVFVITRVQTNTEVEYSKYSTVYYSTLQYGTVEYSRVRYSTVNYSTVQYSKVEYSRVQYSTVYYSTVQYSTVQYSRVQQSTVQYSTVQYSTVYYSTV